MSAKRAIYQLQVTPLFNHTTYTLTSKTVCLFSFLFIAEGSVMFKITELNFWLASTLEIRFTTPAPVKKSKNAGNYSRLAFKFYCVSMTQLLHMYATQGNHSN
jgi:hypothetical protein